jgi:hypothetical protein
MTALRFDGVVKPLRRGGWSARGVITAVRAGQLLQTQVGPRAFEAVEDSAAWLRQVAIERSIEDVHIIDGSLRS